MFTRIGRFTVRRRRLVLALSVLFVLAAGAGGSGAFGAFENEGFEDPGSESYRASRFLQEEIGTDEPEVVLLVEARGGANVDDPAVAAAGTELTEALADEPEVAAGDLLLVAGWSARTAVQRGDGGARGGRRRRRRRDGRGPWRPLRRRPRPHHGRRRG